MSVRIDAFDALDPRSSWSSEVRLAAFVVTALALAACGQGPTDRSATTPKPVQGETAPTTAGGADASVPDAGSVLTPATAAKADPAAGRSNNSMSRTQESSAMPLPGQNNDHSAPLTPARRASGP
jgi:hypothetical protein